MAAFSVSGLRLGLWFLPLCAPLAFGQPQAPSTHTASVCPARPSYPLPNADLPLRALAERLDKLARQPDCLKDAPFHAWRGAVLMALGRVIDAVEPLERALLIDPDLPGAQLDLAQALALQGDSASARSLLEQLGRRADLPGPLRLAIERQLHALATLAPAGKTVENGERWHTRLQLATLGGIDSNLNNGPSNSEITLTLPEVNVTLPLDSSATPRRGGALMSAAQWQGIKAHGASAWVLQGELRSRLTGERETSYQQADLSAAWLSDPVGPRQWLARAGASYLRFGGVSLQQAYRASIQHQWETYRVPFKIGATAGGWGCRPSATLDWEHRRYPSSNLLNGAYQGLGAGLACRPDSNPASRSPTGVGAAPPADPSFSLQARVGIDRPLDDTRAGGSYQKSEIRAQWEGPLLGRGRLGLHAASTLQSDSAPYSVLLGNVPRTVRRQSFQVEASWPLTPELSLIGTAEAARQRSNLTVFDSRQRSFYLGLRWNLM